MEQCDAIRLKYLPTHVQEDAAKNYSMLYKAIAFRAKKLAPEDIATFAFRKANSALRDLQLKETADEEALIKFQQANIVLKLAEELLQQTQLKTTTELNKDQHEGFQHQLKTAEGQLRDLHHRPGAGVLEPSREFWNRQLCRFAAQFVKPLSAFCVCTGFVWDL
jgi:hypothetical protein